ncbi:MAG: polyphosphate kinase 1 [Planctomycetes bacterium]|nr:polyphosphate kinase 1 [Planctomycetota bacterium]
MTIVAPPPNQTLALDDPSLYFNRELSWLEFNRRVLEEAQDPQVPLLERLKFLAIFDSNLDEFYMVRVGGLLQKVQAGIPYGSGADRTPPAEQLDRISQMVRQMNADKHRCFMEDVLPSLEREGIVIKSPKDLSESERKHVRRIFLKEIFPVLTPLAKDPGHPFPHLANKSLNLCVRLRRPAHPEKLYAVVQVPAVLERFVKLSVEKGHAFVPLEGVIRMHLTDLFPGMQLEHDTVFRVTRNSDFEIDDDEVEDLLKTIEEEVRRRRRGTAVRLEIESDVSPEVEDFLTRELDLEPIDVNRNPSLLDLTSMFHIYNLPGYPHLRDPQFVPQLVPEFTQASSIWASIRGRDILVHHPYESFAHVVDFIEAAANDERVLAIKQTLYRTSIDSPIVKALQRAADNGKQVTAVIEIKARLDEERNIVWARQLEKSGVHVVFGFVGLKTHCKVALVVRREDAGIRRYVHLGTGNYNPQTARVYTDLGYFTCNPDFCEDVSALFNYLTGYCELPQWRKLVVAPSRMQSFMIERIQQEMANQQAGKPGRVMAKINGLLEPAMVQALYRASQAGVKIHILCRGICALRPGLPGISENIRVTSVVDRFLEHSRIFYFENGGDPQVLIGSADWMDRNLSRRVEVVWPIEQPDLKQRLIDLLNTGLADNVKARELLPDGSYRRVSATAARPQDDGAAAPEPPRIRSQERFLELAAQNATRMPAEILPPPDGFYEPASPVTSRRRSRKKQTS